MTRAEARKIIRKRRGAMADLAKTVRCSQQFVADILDGVRPVRIGKTSEKILAEAIKLAAKIEADKDREREEISRLCA